MIEGCAMAAAGKAITAAKVMALAAEKMLVGVIACSRLRGSCWLMLETSRLFRPALNREIGNVKAAQAADCRR
jgi:hypothetical protein